MNAPFSTRFRRGACPSLSSPMATGDGLLVRLLPADGGLTIAQLAGLARAADRFGNGAIEITRRGSLQIRGLSEATVGPLSDAVHALDIRVRTGLAIDIPPLAALDPAEIADPRPLAEALRRGAAGLAARLGPKVSIVVDGGGRDWLASVKADIRLVAERPRGQVRWRLSLAGDALTAVSRAVLEEADATEAALSILGDIAALGPEARARDLLLGGEGKASLAHPQSVPAPGVPFSLVDGRVALPAGFPSGSTTAGELESFLAAAALRGVDEVRPAPGNTLLILCAAVSALGVRDAASAAGLIVSDRDPRRWVAACAGHPRCASGRYDTRGLARRLAESPPAWLDGRFTLHLSGCAKQCAMPAGPTVSVIGQSGTPEIVANGTSLPPAMGDDLAPLLEPEEMPAE